jgi:hypothetical protein
VVAIDPIAMVANVVAAEDAVADDAAVVAEAIARMRRRAEQLRDLARRLPGQETRSLRNRPRCRRVTVLITMKTPAMGMLGFIRLPKKPASSRRNIVLPYNTISVRRHRSTSRLRSGTRRLHHNM